MPEQQDLEGGFVRSRDRAAPRISPAEMRAEIAQRTGAASPVQDRRAGDSRRKASVPARPGLFARLLGRKRTKESAGRSNCCIVGVLMLLDRSLALDGLVLEIGEGSALFRQGAHFIFDRTGAEITLRFGEQEKRGRITQVTSKGYIITFFEPLGAQTVSAVLASHGLPS